MLDQYAVFQHRNLRVIASLLVRGIGVAVGVRVPMSDRCGHTRAFAHNHHPVDRFAAGQEFRLTQDGWTTPSRVAAITASLALGLETGGPGDALHLIAAARLVPWLAFVHHRVGRVVGRQRFVALSAFAAAPATTPTICRGAVARVVLIIGVRGVRFSRLVGVVVIATGRLVGGGIGRRAVWALLVVTVGVGPGFLRPTPLSPVPRSRLGFGGFVVGVGGVVRVCRGAVLGLPSRLSGRIGGVRVRIVVAEVAAGLVTASTTATTTTATPFPRPRLALVVRIVGIGVGVRVDRVLGALRDGS